MAETPGDPAYETTPQKAAIRVQDVIGAGGSLVTGSASVFLDGPLGVEFEVTGVLAGPATVGTAVAFYSDGCCEPGLAGQGEHVPGSAEVVALLDGDNELVLLGIERTGQTSKWLEAGAFFSLSTLLNSDWRPSASSCDTSGADSETTFDALARLARDAETTSRGERIAQLTDVASKLAAEAGLISVDGDLRPVDEKHVLRQLIAGVAPESVALLPSVGVLVSGDPSVAGDTAPETLVFVDSTTGNELGATIVSATDVRVWISEPAEGSSVLVYRIASDALGAGCDLGLPDARARLVFGTSPDLVLARDDVMSGEATVNWD